MCIQKSICLSSFVKFLHVSANKFVYIYIYMYIYKHTYKVVSLDTYTNVVARCLNLPTPTQLSPHECSQINRKFWHRWKKNSTRQKACWKWRKTMMFAAFQANTVNMRLVVAVTHSAVCSQVGCCSMLKFFFPLYIYADVLLCLHFCGFLSAYINKLICKCMIKSFELAFLRIAKTGFNAIIANSISHQHLSVIF